MGDSRLTGLHSTHHTNGTLLQNIQPSDNVPTVEHQKREEHSALNLADRESIERDYGTYRIQKRREPPPVLEYKDSKDHELLDWCLKHDVSWVVVSALGD